MVGVATSVSQARHLATTHHPDVVIAAARVAGTSTLPLLHDLRHALCPMTKSIVFAARVNPAELVALADLDIAGYLLWSDLSYETLRHCLAAVLEDDVVVGSHAVMTAFLEAQCGRPQSREAAMQLTERERAVLQGLADGLTRKEIARVLSLSEPTVKRIVAALEAKLDAPNPSVLGLQAAKLGLLR